MVVWGEYCHLVLDWCNFTLFQDEHTDSVKQELTTAEVLQKVKEYNAQINSNLFMNMVGSDYFKLVHFFTSPSFFGFSAMF